MAGEAEAMRAMRAAMLALLDARAAGATVCPSEVARRVARDAGICWREAMPLVHGAVDALVAEEAIALSWKGVGLARRQGPYRIGRRDR